jgi:hypothetical protein
MGASAGKFAVNVAKAGAKAATTGVLTYAIPIFGPLIAGAINSLYAEGGDVQAINDKVKDIAPDNAKFKVINTPEALKKAIQDHPEAARKAGLTADKIDEAVAKMEEQKATMAKGGMVMKKAMAKGGAVKKERSPAQKAATAKMLAALKASKAKK